MERSRHGDHQSSPASRRTDSGKGPSNRLRREGKIPAIAYGKDHGAVAVSVVPKALLAQFPRRATYGKNSRSVELEIDGRREAHGHGCATTPTTRSRAKGEPSLHADFLTVKLDQPVDVEVPFKMVGKSKGVILGGVIQQVYRKLPVRCLPDKIPAFIEADVTDLDIGDSLKASQLALHDGVKVRVPEDQTVVVCSGLLEKAGAEEAAATEKAPPQWLRPLRGRCGGSGCR